MIDEWEIIKFIAAKKPLASPRNDVARVITQKCSIECSLRHNTAMIDVRNKDGGIIR